MTHFQKWKLNGQMTPNRLACSQGCDAFFQLMIHSGVCSSLWSVPTTGGHSGCHKKAAQVSNKGQASKEHYLVASASVPASSFLPCHNSCPDFLHNGL